VALAPRFHARQHGGNTVKDASDVYVDHPVPLVDLESGQWRERHYAGIVNEHVDRSELRAPKTTWAPFAASRRATCLRQVARTKPRSQRCAGSASRRGCHICETAITSVRTGSGKPLTPAGPDLVLFPCVASKNELVTSATRSDALATAAAGK
jgi:hypothetical protein